MNEKDLERIARAVRGSRRDNVRGLPRMDLSNHNRGVDWVARNLADEFAFTHPKFDRARFLTACGVSP